MMSRKSPHKYSTHTIFSYCVMFLMARKRIDSRIFLHSSNFMFAYALPLIQLHYKLWLNNISLILKHPILYSKWMVNPVLPKKLTLFSSVILFFLFKNICMVGRRITSFNSPSKFSSVSTWLIFNIWTKLVNFNAIFVYWINCVCKQDENEIFLKFKELIWNKINLMD